MKNMTIWFNIIYTIFLIKIQSEHNLVAQFHNEKN